MIDLRAGLGAPPIVVPGIRMQRHDLPSGIPGSAPLMPPGQAAANLGCSGVGCLPALSGGVGGLTSTWDRVPTWTKVAGGIVLFSGVAYGAYRLAR